MIFWSIAVPQRSKLQDRNLATPQPSHLLSRGFGQSIKQTCAACATMAAHEAADRDDRGGAMIKHLHQYHQTIPLECPDCTSLFEYSSDRLSAGNPISCPHCHSLFECRTRELFAALKHIHKLAS